MKVILILLLAHTRLLHGQSDYFFRGGAGLQLGGPGPGGFNSFDPFRQQIQQQPQQQPQIQYYQNPYSSQPFLNPFNVHTPQTQSFPSIPSNQGGRVQTVQTQPQFQPQSASRPPTPTVTQTFGAPLSAQQPTQFQRPQQVVYPTQEIRPTFSSGGFVPSNPDFSSALRQLTNVNSPTTTTTQTSTPGPFYSNQFFNSGPNQNQGFSFVLDNTGQNQQPGSPLTLALQSFSAKPIPLNASNPVDTNQLGEDDTTGRPLYGNTPVNLYAKVIEDSTRTSVGGSSTRAPFDDDDEPQQKPFDEDEDPFQRRPIPTRFPVRTTTTTATTELPRRRIVTPRTRVVTTSNSNRRPIPPSENTPRPRPISTTRFTTTEAPEETLPPVTQPAFQEVSRFPPFPGTGRPVIREGFVPGQVLPGELPQPYYVSNGQFKTEPDEPPATFPQFSTVVTTAAPEVTTFPETVAPVEETEAPKVIIPARRTLVRRPGGAGGRAIAVGPNGRPLQGRRRLKVRVQNPNAIPRDPATPSAGEVQEERFVPTPAPAQSPEGITTYRSKFRFIPKNKRTTTVSPVPGDNPVDTDSSNEASSSAPVRTNESRGDIRRIIRFRQRVGGKDNSN